jgi:hypothetical protein
VRELGGVVLMELEAVLGQAERLVPVHPVSLPELEPPHVVRLRIDEELHLHLLELPRPENEVAGGDLVAKRLADLRDAERDLLPCALLHVEEIHEDPLCGLRAQVGDRRSVLDRPHECLEHEVELTRLGERPFHATRRTLGVRRAGRSLDAWIVGAEALLAIPAIHERVDEPRHVTARFPDARVHQDRRVEPFDVAAGANHRLPPAILEIPFQLHAKRPVIPHRAGATIDLGRLEDEAAALAQRHELVHHIGVGAYHGHGTSCSGRGSR